MKIEFELQHYLMNTGLLASVTNYFFKGYECDLLTISNRLYSTEYEIKMSKADFNNDFKKKTKKYNWQLHSTEILNRKHDLINEGKRTNRFYFVVNESLEVDVPKYAGLITFKITESIRFDRIKTAPRLHNDTVPDKTINHLVKNLSWRCYHLNFDKFKKSDKLITEYL